MANRKKKKYGYTALFPVYAEHLAELRSYLRRLDQDPHGSPLSETRVIHMARFVVIDHFPYQGAPAKRDELKSPYLLFMSDFDGESVDVLVRGLVAANEPLVTEVWGHCVAFPGVQSLDRLAAYFEECQIKTNLFVADRPDDTVQDILRALKWKQDFAELVVWIEREAALSPARLRERLEELRRAIEDFDAPHPGSL